MYLCMIQTIYSILKDTPPTNEYPIPVKRFIYFDQNTKHNIFTGDFYSH